MDNKTIVSRGKASAESEKASKHTPSKIQADTLFNFTTELKHIISAIENKMLSPRYCEEDIRYLKISHLKKIAYPMKCFCDINLHRIEEHLQWYGYYGLAFTKDWGMQRQIQPIHYINPESELRKDFTKVFSAALKSDPRKESKTQSKMKNFLLHELMYYKPYEGRMKNRNTGKIEKKCFTDECEWRFSPDVTRAGFEQVYFDEDILNAGRLSDYCNAMFGIREISLNFDYADLKYIIVKTRSDFEFLTEAITALGLDKSKEYQLVSKVTYGIGQRGIFNVC